MNKEKIQKQLSEIATAANSLATALTTLSIDIGTDLPCFDQHHCGQDAVNEEQLPDDEAERLVNGYKNYCRATLEAFLDRKITWWQLKQKLLMPDLIELVKACSVGDGNAVVDEPAITGESLKPLLGMQVIKVCGPKCKDCPSGNGPREYPSGRDMSSCCKVELVGGFYLCLEPLPNSIVTE